MIELRAKKLFASRYDSQAKKGKKKKKKKKKKE